jgi:hypothetical protein
MLYKVEDINRVEDAHRLGRHHRFGILGLTVGCARCHDHKFDPIPQRDYMALQAIFQPAEKSRVFLQYDAARGLRSRGSRAQGKDCTRSANSCRRCHSAEVAGAVAARPAANPAGGRGAPASAPAMKPRGTEQKLRALEQQLVQMFRTISPAHSRPAYTTWAASRPHRPTFRHATDALRNQCLQDS